MGSLVDRHFKYNELIDSSFDKGDYESVKKYCLQEIEEFPKIGEALKEKLGELPPTIPCRDTLLYILVDVEKKYDEAERLLELLVQKQLYTAKEEEDELKKVKIAKVYDEGENLLATDKFEDTTSIVNQLMNIDYSEAAKFCKRLGNYLLEKNNEQEALNYFQKALEVNPLLNGVERKVKLLAKKLGVNINLDKNETFTILQKKEKDASTWTEKMNLAKAYTKIKENDHAWRLYNEVLQMIYKYGGSCYKIYIEMANLLESEEKYKDALFRYLIAYRENFRFGMTEPPKNLSKKINLCLKKLGLININSDDIIKIVRENTDLNYIKESFAKLFN